MNRMNKIYELKELLNELNKKMEIIESQAGHLMSSLEDLKEEFVNIADVSDEIAEGD